jgi:hypothetical protein
MVTTISLAVDLLIRLSSLTSLSQMTPYDKCGECSMTTGMGKTLIGATVGSMGQLNRHRQWRRFTNTYMVNDSIMYTMLITGMSERYQRAHIPAFTRRQVKKYESFCPLPNCYCFAFMEHYVLSPGKKMA